MRTMASDTLVASAGLTMMSPYLAKSLWPVMPPSPRRNQMPGSTPKPSFTSTAGKRDVVGVFQHRDLAGAVEGDVELARQPVQRAIIEDVIVPLAGIFAGIQQLLRIDPGRRRARDVADVVGAGAARAQAEILDAFDQRHRVLRRNLAHLQIGPRGDVAERSAQSFGEIGQAGKLPVLHDAVRDPQPAHVGILRRRHIEQAVIAPAEIIRRVRRRIVERLLLQPRIGIERMLLALEFFLVGELLAGGCDLVLRLDMRGIRPGRFGIRLAGVAAAEAAPHPADLQAGGKAFEVAFLLVGKIDCKRFDLHGARRSSCGHEGWHQRSGMRPPRKPARPCEPGLD